MTSPQEGRYTKIGAIVGVIALIVAFLAWIHPFAPRSDTSAAETGKTTTSDSSTQPPPGTDDESHSPDSGKPPAEEVSSAGSASGEESGARPRTERLDLAKPTGVCDTETATVRPGAPARVASGLAVLSVQTAREGSEPYLTLGIASDRDTLAKAVLGAPTRFQFKTSLGTYFVNVVEADLAAGAMTVQVGCEAEGNTP